MRHLSVAPGSSSCRLGRPVRLSRKPTQGESNGIRVSVDGSFATLRACVKHFRFAPDTGRIAASQRTDAKGPNALRPRLRWGPFVPQKADVRQISWCAVQRVRMYFGQGRTLQGEIKQQPQGYKPNFESQSLRNHLRISLQEGPLHVARRLPTWCKRGSGTCLV